ncbi:MAG: hypothetical protein ACRCU2_22245, partial [Planktothrix sp.]
MNRNRSNKNRVFSVPKSKQFKKSVSILLGILGFLSAVVTLIESKTFIAFIMSPIVVPRLVLVLITLIAFTSTLYLLVKTILNNTQIFHQDKKINKCFESFYHFQGTFASSIRMVGADDEFFLPNNIHILSSKSPYHLPPKLLLARTEIINLLEEDAKSKGRLLYDGPHTRLVGFRVELREKTERKHLEMELGPVNWYDYSVCRWAVTENSIDPNDYIDLDEVAELYDIRSNQFPNILCTATTIITKDGFALYSQRSSKVSDKSQTLTSCIAENIHQDFDFSSEKDCIAELPVPFRTVIRGVEEEISPGIADYLKNNNHAIFLLGLDFNIELFHPNLLFMIALPLDCEEVYEQCRQRPGRDFLEGQLKSISICPIN